MTTNGVTPFQSNLAHLRDELALLNLRLSREVLRLRRQAASSPEDEFKGLVVSEHQVDTIFRELVGDREAEDARWGPLASQISHREEELAHQTAMSLEVGVPLRLVKLKSLFRLSDFDVGVIMICLAPELDLRYEVLYSYLQEDVGKKQPTVNLALNALCSNFAERMERRQSFVYPAPLAKHALVNLCEESFSKDSAFSARILKINPRIADFLLDSDTTDAPLNAFARLLEPVTTWPEVVLREETGAQLQRVIEEVNNSAPGDARVVLQLVGPKGTGKKSVAQALVRSLGSKLFLVDGAGLLSSDLAPESLVSQVFREARLQDAILCVDNFHVFLGDDPRVQSLQTCFARSVEEQTGLCIIAGERRWRPQPALEKQSLLTVELHLPEYSEREHLWQQHLREYESGLPAEEISSLVGKFRFSGGQIRQAIASAVSLARWRAGGAEGITSEELHASCRWHSNQQLELLAQRIIPRYSWDDIVLPPEQKNQLWEICKCFENMPLVYGTWGFQSKTSLGKGLNILFAGPSGTGKTMAAEIMAGRLGLDLYKIDLSTIVSKYIGETEKNLDRIFREAQDSNAILLFDEADAIFGKRSEVRDAHDRYANIEISYLLQKMEEYQGITILTTNFRKNIDDAFVRRIHFAVEFPFPEEEYRLQIWQRVFPDEAPVESMVDLLFLARQFKVAGGNIKNIAVTAAFLAAQDQAAIGMEHVIQATKREYQKMGRLLIESDFEQYFELVRR